MPRPTYRCKLIRFVNWHSNRWIAEMTVLDEHPNSRAGTTGYTSQLISVDFVNRIMVTRNSIYQWED